MYCILLERSRSVELFGIKCEANGLFYGKLWPVKVDIRCLPLFARENFDTRQAITFRRMLRNETKNVHLQVDALSKYTNCFPLPIQGFEKTTKNIDFLEY